MYLSFIEDAMQESFMPLCKFSARFRMTKVAKGEVFKLLCDERVPRNIVYSVTISIMKHQPLVAQREVEDSEPGLVGK